MSLWNTDSRSWQGKPTFIAVAHPSSNDFYALDLSGVPLGDSACPSSLVEGSGTDVEQATNTISFDCADGSVYARFNRLGVPASTNVSKADARLPAYRLDVDAAGTLHLTDDLLALNEVASLWR